MILTITLNPAVDIGYSMDALIIDAVNRVDTVSKTAGGKGLNVARVLRQLGETVATTGFLGGSLGVFIREELADVNIQDFFVEIEAETRNCIAIIHEGKQTEILESGPTITDEEANDFLKCFSSYIKKVNVVTISGSLPRGLPSNYYNQLLNIAAQQEVPVLLDTNGNVLKETLQTRKPFLIKPNQEELSDVLGKELLTIDDIICGLQLPIFSTIPWVVVTLGEHGALIKHQHQMYRVTSPQVEVVNPVGSGDAVIAGFAAAFAKGLRHEKVIRYGLTMGVLNALESKTGSINVERIEEIMEKMEIERI